VDVEDLVPARRARFVDLLVFADAGVVDEDVEAPELLRGTVDEGEACGLGANVSLREDDFGAGALELGRHALAALAVPVAECHARALGNETPDRRLADPRCTACHGCDLAVEPSHLRHLSLRSRGSAPQSTSTARVHGPRAFSSRQDTCSHRSRAGSAPCSRAANILRSVPRSPPILARACRAPGMPPRSAAPPL